MTGPEHYKEAERMLRAVAEGGTWYREITALALAQVHATLAATAASALGAGDYDEWIAAIRGGTP